ncbi:TonB-dependent receptor [Alteromonas oceanisediminis]|uniref:TonB-dependent receptor n=1 Tax=Alteromonas oceanisediminis TaxID=2836180 RepID=UPI001BD9C3C9|nr:TonB-dependent receptor [Alteromonas oceanisediminis]MBT0586473.1 TonB-dependent receptor [Alteromonas oceanisediminis]
MTHFKPNLIKIALISSGFAFGSGQAIAQQEQPEAEKQDYEVIQVSGIRGSLQRAQAIKMDNTSIVEALSAEDIGKLPDTSIAESLARLPGLAGERRDGRSSGLSVRGFNENYVGTSLNGRELLGMGDNRGVEYDLYPSEIVANVLVYKTPDASLMSQGIGGTVDLQTINPLGKERTITFNGSFEQNGMDSANPDFDDQGHRFSLNFVDSFADDTIGVALTIASMESPSQEEQFRGWGYADANPEKAAPGVTVPAGTRVLGGHDSFVRSAVMERDSIASVIEWAPSDELTVKLDALYIDFNEDKVFRGIEEGGAEWGTQSYTINEVQNGLVTAGTFSDFISVIRNDAESKEAELTTFGLNVEYLINDEWTAELDISTGDVEKTITNIESYSGVGRAGIDGRAAIARSWVMTPQGALYSDHPSIETLDYTNPDLIRLAGPQAWGNPIFGSTSQDGFVNQPDFDESLDSARFTVDGFVDYGIISGVEAGIAYSDRSKTKINTGAYLTAPDFPGDAPIPNVLGVADLSFIGINGVLAYDSLGLYNSGYYIENDAALVQNDRFGDTYTINEELLTLYTKFDIEADFGDTYLRGNFGVQVIDVDQSGSGFNVTTDADGFANVAPVTGGAEYTSVLPSLNLSLEIAENQFIRTALSRTESRPRMDDMRPNAQVSFAFNDNQITNPNPENGPWSGSAGNPQLRPLAANQFDLSYENYYADSGFFAVAFFFKDLRNWHRDSSRLADFSDVYIPSFHQGSEGQTPATFQGLVSAKQDGLTGFVQGWELQASVPFDIFHESLDGFGMFASATFMNGQLSDGAGVPGLSDEGYQLTAYYEKAGFEFRVSGRKRSDFVTETRGLSLSLVETIDQGSELWDAQIAYDFSESNIEMLDGLRITLQGQNLTDEETVQTNADSREVLKYQTFGRNFLLGFNYTF